MAASAEVAASMLQAAIAGGPLVNSTAHQFSSASRSVIIQLHNKSSHILKHPRVYTYSGYCFDPPQPTVENGATEMSTFVKTEAAACGAVGVLTYDIAKDQKKKAVKRLAIMFSVPYDYNLHENWFALGLFYTSQACDKSLYELMYYKKGSFSRGKASGSEVSFRAGRYTLRGTMSAAAKAEIKVELEELE